MTSRALTTDEEEWIQKLRKLFRKMPATLLLVECADALLVVDRKAARGVELSDGSARDAGVVLADIEESATKITSVSG